MSLTKRLLFILSAVVLLLVVGYFIFTGKNMAAVVPEAAPLPQVSEGQAP